MKNSLSESSILAIVEMDKKARERVFEAQKQVEKINSDAQEQKRKLMAQYRDDSESSLKAAEAEFRKDAEEKIHLINTQKDKKIADFDKILEENKEALKDSIFENITGCKRRR